MWVKMWVDTITIFLIFFFCNYVDQTFDFKQKVLGAGNLKVTSSIWNYKSKKIRKIVEDVKWVKMFWMEG